MKRFLLIAALSWCALAHAAEIPLAADLGDDAARAGSDGKPLVVLYTASYCEYCEAVKTGYFRHLEADPRYASRIILREVVIDSALTLTDFDGNDLTHGRFAEDRGVMLVPTVRFLDSRGETVADPLVGVTNLEFYGWYLDQRIQIAMKRVRPRAATEREPG